MLIVPVGVSSVDLPVSNSISIPILLDIILAERWRLVTEFRTEWDIGFTIFAVLKLGALPFKGPSFDAYSTDNHYDYCHGMDPCEEQVPFNACLEDHKEVRQHEHKHQDEVNQL